MATFDVDIKNTVLKAKCVAACRANTLFEKENAGESINNCDWLKLILLSKWIKILESYYLDNFGDGGDITPEYACLTLDQAQLLLGKLKAFIK